MEQPAPSPRLGGDFVDTAVLETFVPSASEVDLQEIFSSWDGEVHPDSTSIVPFIEQRPFLLLALPEDVLKRYLSRLELNLEVRAVGQQLQKAGDTPNAQLIQVTETLHVQSLKSTDDPLICATEVQVEGSSETTHYIYVFWKVTFTLGRPKGRLQKLGIFFAPTALLNPHESTLPVGDPNDEYLPEQVPASPNILQYLGSDPALHAIQPRLSAARLSPLSLSALDQVNRPIRNGPRRLFKAGPAYLWRVRYLRYPNAAEQGAIFASLDIEITQFAGADVTLDKASVHTSSGQVEPIGVQLPQRYRPGEHLTLVYKIHPPGLNERIVDNASSPRTLAVSVTSTVHVSDICLPKVKFKWKSILEIPSSRPNSRSGSLPQEVTELLTPRGPDYLPYNSVPTDIGPPAPSASFSGGVSVTVSGPKKVRIGELFRWEVLVINRSERPYRLAIIAIAKRRLADLYPNARRPSSATFSERGKHTMTNPIVDENVIYSLQKSSTLDPTDLICLTPDVRVGNLGASACYEADLRFLPLATGVLQLEALRLVDLGTQHTIDVRQLPDVFCTD